MSDPLPPKRPMAEVLEEILLEEEIRELTEMDPAVLDKELEGTGYDPERLRKRIEAEREKMDGSSPAKAAPKVASLDAMRARRAATVRLVPLAAAAGVALAMGGGGYQYAATYKPPVTVTYPTTVAALTPEQVAARLRTAGLRACAQGYYAECWDWLDEAKKLSPEGEDAPKVKEARSLIESYDHGDAPSQMGELYAKPHLGPGERPLQRKP